MSSGFASVRCVRCGAYTQGSQVCGDCTERQQADEAARTERVAQAIADRPANATASPTAGACPSCGRLAGPGAIFCGFCRYQFRALAPGETRADGKPVDTVGAGRYILSFILAGFVGLGIQYLARNYGWRGVIINAVIFAVVLVLFLILSASSAGCYDEYGNYTC
jgi:hypothetical protein